ncbi:hypothetical protein [Cupriavidus sp. UYPR2.512]|uniref:hypothetical protein n=1 Tax=Cupriavidus sp. UYPR2.512 TaxID=1080187 RepID=UPI0012FC5B01|nr:hypothetical protein [Cupriavidus sp. UYPR2.512]UIF86111.1 hypothetical protein KAF44_19175 [Cupriavidus necator]
MAILAARDQHRSLGQFVAWAVSEKLRTLTFRVTCDNRTEQVSTEEAVALLWSVEEADRVVKLGMHAPHLMTFEEQVAYQRIVEDGAVWVAMDMPDLPRIRAKWAVYTEGLAMEHDNP